MNASIGEEGFDRVRFGGRMPESYAVGLCEVLPLLISIPDKQRTMVDQIAGRTVAEIVNICAGKKITLQWDPASIDTVAVSLRKRTLTLSPEIPCGLLDLILAATLFRQYREAGSPESYNLVELIESVWLLLAEKLPHALTYCSAADPENAQSGTIPIGLAIGCEPDGTGQTEIHFQVA